MLVPLPSYAPKLNLQEQIWRWLRADVTHDHFFGSLDAAVAAAKRFFAKVAEQPAAVLSRIGRTRRSTGANPCSSLRELH